ncbi:MAG: SlyX family protein [Phycisphaerales bacterium JB063]
MDPTPRLIALEEKMSHLEKYLGELDEVIRELAGRLDTQAKGVQQMRKVLEQHLAGGEDDAGSAPDPEADRPPHW